jgi:hypothetical protein
MLAKNKGRRMPLPSRYLKDTETSLAIRLSVGVRLGRGGGWPVTSRLTRTVSLWLPQTSIESVPVVGTPSWPSHDRVPVQLETSSKLFFTLSCMDAGEVRSPSSSRRPTASRPPVSPSLTRDLLSSRWLSIGR